MPPVQQFQKKESAATGQNTNIEIQLPTGGILTDATIVQTHGSACPTLDAQMYIEFTGAGEGAVRLAQGIIGRNRFQAVLWTGRVPLSDKFTNTLIGQIRNETGSAIDVELCAVVEQL